MPRKLSVVFFSVVLSATFAVTARAQDKPAATPPAVSTAAPTSGARALGTLPPAGIDPKAIMANAGDKAKVVQGLKDSFAHFRFAILAIKDSEVDNAQKMFGQQTTVRGAFILITGHLGEHLGQSIAYARQNGIAPPWTEERQKQEAAKPKQ